MGISISLSFTLCFPHQPYIYFALVKQFYTWGSSWFYRMCGFSHTQPHVVPFSIRRFQRTQFQFHSAFQSKKNSKKHHLNLKHLQYLCFFSFVHNNQIEKPIFILFPLRMHWNFRLELLPTEKCMYFDGIFSVALSIMTPSSYMSSSSIDDVISILSPKSRIEMGFIFEKVHRHLCQRRLIQCNENRFKCKQQKWFRVTLTIFPSIKVYHRHFSHHIVEYS